MSKQVRDAAPVALFVPILALLVGLVALAMAQTVQATAIAVVITPFAIVIAADSRETGANQQPLRDDACKIQLINDTAIAAHNFSTYKRTGFDVFRLVRIGIEGEKTLRAMANGVVRSLRVAMARSLHNMQQTHPTNFQQYLTSGTVSGVFIARFEDGKPRLAYIKFTLSRKGKDFTLKPETQFCPEQCGSEGHAAFFSTYGSDDYAASICLTADCFSTPHEIAIKYVKSQVARRIPQIAKPIDAIEISAGGPNWLQLKPSCPTGYQ